MNHESHTSSEFSQDLSPDGASRADRALTLMGSQQWNGSARNLRVEDAIAGRTSRSFVMKRRQKMIVAGLLVGLVGSAAIAAAVRELIFVQGVAIDDQGNRVEFSGMAEVENGVGEMKVVGPNGEDMSVMIQRVEGDGKTNLQVEMTAPPAKDGDTGTRTIELRAGQPLPAQPASQPKPVHSGGESKPR